MSYTVILTTAPSREEAIRLAEDLVEKKLAACAQVLGPMTSVFFWQGKKESASEWLCLIKTRKALFSSPEKEIKKLHPYSVPQIVALPIEAGNREYLSWVEETLSKK